MVNGRANLTVAVYHGAARVWTSTVRDAADAERLLAARGLSPRPRPPSSRRYLGAFSLVDPDRGHGLAVLTRG